MNGEWFRCVGVPIEMSGGSRNNKKRRNKLKLNFPSLLSRILFAHQQRFASTIALKHLARQQHHHHRSLANNRDDRDPYTSSTPIASSQVIDRCCSRVCGTLWGVTLSTSNLEKRQHEMGKKEEELGIKENGRHRYWLDEPWTPVPTSTTPAPKHHHPGPYQG